MRVYAATGEEQHARHKMCIDTVSSDGGEGITTDAIAGRITTKTKFNGIRGLPSEIRLRATDLVFANGAEVDEIATNWLKVEFNQ